MTFTGGYRCERCRTFWKATVTFVWRNGEERIHLDPVRRREAGGGVGPCPLCGCGDFEVILEEVP